MQLNTRRLLIRELMDGDWHSMQKIAIDFRLSEYAEYDMPLPIQDAEIQALTQRFAASGLFFAVLLKETEEMIGYICFHEGSGSCDLGYCFHSAHRGKGYAFEGCSALIEEFAQNRHVKTFTAGTALKNTPSCALLRKLGFVLTGTEMLSFREGFSFEGGVFTKQQAVEKSI